MTHPMADALAALDRPELEGEIRKYRAIADALDAMKNETILK